MPKQAFSTTNPTALGTCPFSFKMPSIPNLAHSILSKALLSDALEITPAALAFITAVGPPDCANNKFPFDISTSLYLSLVVTKFKSTKLYTKIIVKSTIYVSNCVRNFSAFCFESLLLKKVSFCDNFWGTIQNDSVKKRPFSNSLLCRQRACNAGAKFSNAVACKRPRQTLRHV